MARSEPNIFSQKWGKGWAGAEASITTASAAVCAIAVEFSAIALREPRRIAMKPRRLVINILAAEPKEGAPLTRCAKWRLKSETEAPFEFEYPTRQPGCRRTEQRVRDRTPQQELLTVVEVLPKLN